MQIDSGVSGVTVVTQKPPVVTVRKGETATMDCDSAIDGPRWYKQIPGGVPQFILIYYHSWSSPSYGSGFSSPKFTPTYQSASNYRLTITNVEEGNSAVYYCQTWDSSVRQEVVLNCNIQRDDGNYVSWYKQVPGEAPKYVLRFYHSHSSPSFGSGFSSNRFNSKSSSN
ncbi:hypothetical protein FQN60_003863, partial [Etheostoma spectabile]